MPTYQLQACLTPDERRAEIARILARGVQRRKQSREQADRFSSENPVATPPTCLELPAETSLTVHHVPRVNAAENLKRGAR